MYLDVLEIIEKQWNSMKINELLYFLLIDADNSYQNDDVHNVLSTLVSLDHVLASLIKSSQVQSSLVKSSLV